MSTAKFRLSTLSATAHPTSGGHKHSNIIYNDFIGLPYERLSIRVYSFVGEVFKSLHDKGRSACTTLRLSTCRVLDALLRIDVRYRTPVELFYPERAFLQSDCRNSQDTNRHGYVEVVEGQRTTQIDRGQIRLLIIGQRSANCTQRVEE